MPDDAIGYVVTVYTGRGLPPDRTDFEDKIKAEKAFTDAKFAAILWQSRPPTHGLGWIKMKEKEAPPPAPPAPAKPAAPAAVTPTAAPAAVPAAAPAAKPVAIVPAAVAAAKSAAAVQATSATPAAQVPPPEAKS